MSIIMTTEGIELKIKEIKRQIGIINSVGGDIIDYSTATGITHNLIELQSEYERELKKRGNE